jgi:hypothetical protein
MYAGIDVSCARDRYDDALKAIQFLSLHGESKAHRKQRPDCSLLKNGLLQSYHVRGPHRYLR